MRGPAVFLATVVVACAPVEAPPAPPPPPGQGAPTVVGDTATDLPPVGYGSLHQDEFSVDLANGNLNIKVTPLTERVIRLAAPDTYERLRALATSRTAAAEEATQGRGADLFLVSFFSREPDVEYRPEELLVAHRGRSLRPAGIVPLTTGWGRQLLQPQETQSAIYVFEPLFDYDLPITVRYNQLQSDDWHQVVIQKLEEERSRVESRSGGWSRSS